MAGIHGVRFARLQGHIVNGAIRGNQHLPVSFGSQHDQPLRGEEGFGAAPLGVEIDAHRRSYIRARLDHDAAAFNVKGQHIAR